MANRTGGREGPRLNLVAKPPVVFGVPYGIGIVLHVMTGSNIEPGSNPVMVVFGAVMIAAGLFLSGWSTIALRKVGEHPDPSHPTSTLVTGGPFRFTRNPIYLSFALLATGIGAVLNSPWMLGAVPVALIALHVMVIRREEQYLESVIGEEYDSYRVKVRRWI